MTDPQQNPEILKHVKHLENQNHKLRRLLISTLDVADKNFASVSMLQEESKSLETTVDNLEKEKNDLENLLVNVLSNDENSINLSLLNLEKEYLELRSKLDEALDKINKENEEIDNLQSEDTVLKNTISKLEETKRSLQERIKFIEDKESVLSAISSKLKSQLSEIEQKEAFVVQIISKKEVSDEKIAPEDTSKLSVNKMQPNADSFSSLSDKEKEVIIAFPHVQYASSEEINDMVPRSSLIDRKIMELETAKIKLYNDLEETIQNYSNEIDEIKSELSDPEIKKLIHEIDIQKTVLMYNLKLAKLHDEADPTKVTSSPDLAVKKDAVLDPTTSISDEAVEPEEEIKQTKIESLTRSLELKIADLTKNLGIKSETEKVDPNYESSTSNNNHTQLQLDQKILKLENERSTLLKQLHSVSAISAQQFEERLLQTQSELHSTFMREISSDTIVDGNKFDDATNQLYATEEARLEQRIRELEADNDRIKKELYNILQEIEMEQSVVQPEMQKLLKQGIDELENKENDTIGINAKQ